MKTKKDNNVPIDVVDLLIRDNPHITLDELYMAMRPLLEFSMSNCDILDYLQNKLRLAK